MLQRLSGAATSILDLDRLTGLILDEVTSTIHIERAAFFLQDARTRRYAAGGPARPRRPR